MNLKQIIKTLLKTNSEKATKIANFKQALESYPGNLKTLRNLNIQNSKTLKKDLQDKTNI